MLPIGPLNGRLWDDGIRPLLSTMHLGKTEVEMLPIEPFRNLECLSASHVQEGL